MFPSSMAILDMELNLDYHRKIFVISFKLKFIRLNFLLNLGINIQ